LQSKFGTLERFDLILGGARAKGSSTIGERANRIAADSELFQGGSMEEIKVITTIDNDGFVPVLDPKFVVLGMLDEYLGRLAIEGGSTVEAFFVNERPIANVFAKYLTQFGLSVDVDSTEISVVESETGHSRVESRTMNALVNALYQFEFQAERFLTTLDGQKRRVAHVTLGIEDFPKRSSPLYMSTEMNPRFSYLYGVLLRFGRDGLIVEMANAGRKIELIKHVLEELNVE
jgi:hypothetical protein